MTLTVPRFSAKIETPVMMDIKRMLRDGLRSNQSTLSLHDISSDQEDLTLKKFTEIIAQSVAVKRSARLSESLTDKVQTEALPRTITFPYSRHSSYEELCHLVRIFHPKDVYPCTVDEENWDEGMFLPVASLPSLNRPLDVREKRLRPLLEIFIESE
jgi:hypothetical protein